MIRMMNKMKYKSLFANKLDFQWIVVAESLSHREFENLNSLICELIIQTSFVNWIN